MTQTLPDKASFAPALRQVDIAMGRECPLDEALDKAGLSYTDYIGARAADMGLRADQVERLYRSADRTDPQTAPAGRLAGTCTVCGGSSGFEAFNIQNLRESGLCLDCGSYNRQRQMAHILRLSLGLLPCGPVALPDRLAVHNTESTGPLHGLLRAGPGYTFSEYWGLQYSPGQIVQGIRHEDLQRLSFADESLDVILSSDVLEHMPDPYQAHAEIFRVLKPGGRHIFTAPFHGGERDDVRARLEHGEIQYLAEKAYHGDPVRPEEGILVWTIFGTEMLDRLRDIGFHAALWGFSEPGHGILGHAIVFEAVKPGPSHYAIEDPQYLVKAIETSVEAKLALRTAEIEAQLLSAQSDLAQTRNRAAAQAARIAEMESSTSWRVTAPLRSISAKLKS